MVKKIERNSPFKYKTKRFLFGKIAHFFLELISSSSDNEIQKLLTDFNYFKEKLEDTYFFSLGIDEKISKYAWNFIRSRYRYNFIRFVKKLRKNKYNLLKEHFILCIDEKTGKISKIIKPDLIFINKSKKKLVIIEIKTGIRYMSFKRQLKKYYKCIKKFYPDYNIEIYLYRVKKDEMAKIDMEGKET